MSNFEIIDRRRKNTGEPAIEFSEPTADDVIGQQWADVQFMVAYAPAAGGGIIIMGRAIGLRSDGVSFVADYWFESQWADGFDWTKKARERLDSFLRCQCVSRAPCSTHKLMCRQWIEQDTKRLQMAMDAPIPPAIEAYILAERAARTGIVVPG